VRYVVQMLIPALVVIVVTLVLLRNRGNPSAPASGAAAGPDDAGSLSTGTFIAILVIGATFTVALIYALHAASG
jgi:hypothetical protein